MQFTEAGRRNQEQTIQRHRQLPSTHGTEQGQTQKAKKITNTDPTKKPGVNTTVREEYTAPVSCKKPFMFSIGTSFKIFK